jgi:hypothetical protein
MEKEHNRREEMLKQENVDLQMVRLSCLLLMLGVSLSKNVAGYYVFCVYFNHSQIKKIIL